MTENDPPGPSGQRTLAAILFTDVVSFSARMEADEDHTLPLVRRDLDHMTGVCEAAGGKVLKNTGDGLLMYFTSAVNAVQCALSIQRHFAEQAETLPSEDTLQHRVGIHLGDVFLDGEDVMGDGVNVAARIQAEAEPGGICVSQTVYDVVKNRIGVQSTYLGPRELKNIREAVPVYRILLAAQDQLAGAPAAPDRKRLWLWLAAGGVACVLVAGGLWWALRGGHEPTTTTAAKKEDQAPGGGQTPPAGTKKSEPEPVTVTFPSQPTSVADVERLYQELGKTPQGAAATFIGALLLWERSRTLAAECVALVVDRDNRDASEKIPLRARMRLRQLDREPQIARSYIKGATPENGYRIPAPPYVVEFESIKYTTANRDRAEVRVHSNGADSARSVVLKRGEDGFWKVDQGIGLIMGVKPPAPGTLRPPAHTPPARQPRSPVRPRPTSHGRPGT